MTARLRFTFTLLMSSSFMLAAPAADAVPREAGACIAHVPEAARRSGLSEDVVARVMLAESAGNARIVSPKGAMGCMQIMPATWGYLTSRYNLGAEPFEPRMNVIGGAMYLAELAARYGWPGALSAYNAGPGRYQRYVQGRVALPPETIAYTARLGGNAAAWPSAVATPRWQEARLFVTRPAFEDAAVFISKPTPDRGTDELPPRNSLFPVHGPSAGGTTGAGP